jgi:hypothetical protein
VIVGNQDFVCGHFSNDPVFQTTLGTATELNQQGTLNANQKNSVSNLAAP